MFASFLETPEKVLYAAPGWADDVSGSSSSHDEDSGLSLSPDEALGPFPSPGEASGTSVSPGEASGTSVSPCEASGTSHFPGEVSEAIRLGGRNKNLSSGAKYFTQCDDAVGDLPSPPPKDDSPIVSMLSFHYGCVTDNCYRQPSTAILVAGNCVSVKPAKGLATAMVQKYPYADVYSSRRRMCNANRAIVQDRPIPGTFAISRSSSSPRNPAIVTIFSQFFTGPAFESNLFSQMLVKDIKVRGRAWLKSLTATSDPAVCDLNLYTGLQWDTEVNRVQWFRQALERLAGVLREEGIERIVVPYGIGCGPAGGNWVPNYLMAVEALEARVRRLGVQVVVVTDVDDEKPVPPLRIREDGFSKYRPHQTYKPYSRDAT
ncbi:uncharacterized protein [Macrobrachium rosenbergii]|uniref:uncharacterized protein n=1 Tax=Macrobrachium rosenbergii TaxID=79674 RepID=UPI0034D56155